MLLKFSMNNKGATTMYCPDTGEKLLDRIDAAQYIQSTPGTMAVWDSIKRHNLRRTKRGKKIYYYTSSLKEYLQRQIQTE